eukprot:6057974-Pleurochrysis_carterae.AAC.1
MLNLRSRIRQACKNERRPCLTRDLEYAKHDEQRPRLHFSQGDEFSPLGSCTCTCTCTCTQHAHAAHVYTCK